MPPEKIPEISEWLMLAIVAGVAAVVHLLKALARGDAFSPRNIVIRHVSRALITSAGAMTVWTALTEFRELNPATSVGLACGVALIGVDVLESTFLRWLDEKAGLNAKKKEVNNDGSDSGA